MKHIETNLIIKPYFNALKTKEMHKMTGSQVAYMMKITEKAIYFFDDYAIAYWLPKCALMIEYKFKDENGHISFETIEKPTTEELDKVINSFFIYSFDEARKNASFRANYYR